MAARSDYERGFDLGLYVGNDHASGGNYDPRWDLADESRTNTREGFAEFRRGLGDGIAKAREGG
jgi:hypothetical protein